MALSHFRDTRRQLYRVCFFYGYVYCSIYVTSLVWFISFSDDLRSISLLVQWTRGPVRSRPVPGCAWLIRRALVGAEPFTCRGYRHKMNGARHEWLACQGTASLAALLGRGSLERVRVPFDRWVTPVVGLSTCPVLQPATTQCTAPNSSPMHAIQRILSTPTECNADMAVSEICYLCVIYRMSFGAIRLTTLHTGGKSRHFPLTVPVIAANLPTCTLNASHRLGCCDACILLFNV